MSFVEPGFIFLFLPVTLFLYFAAGRRMRNAVLVAAGFYFYASLEGKYSLLLAASIACNYLFGLWIDRARGAEKSRGSGPRLPLVLGIVINLEILVCLKYLDFFVHLLGRYIPYFSRGELPGIALHQPVGLSFFTFQAITYLVDVYRSDAPAQRNPFRAALYISLFPHIMAGPIVKYREIAGQLAARTVSREGFADGAARFIVGLGKKVIIADHLAVRANLLFSIPGIYLTPGLAWLGAVCYTLQIYFDFSGYSDMAIGIGRMLGFNVPENFNYPYISCSVREFWRRWHISLSTWFRDYLYIPLGGGRAGAARVYFNLLTVFFLCGLWHGASLNFVVWGLYHGAFMVLERAGLSKILDRLPRLIARAYAMLVVTVGWVIFRGGDLGYACSFLRAMFGLAKAGGARETANPFFFGTDFIVVMLIAAVACLPVAPALETALERAAAGRRSAISALRVAAIALIFAVSLLMIAGESYTPFLYSKF